MKILAIDPGIRGSGIAEFVDGRLVNAEYVSNSRKTGNGPLESAAMAYVVFHLVKNVDTLVLEKQKTYGGRAARGDANDLFPLAAVNGAFVALFTDAGVVSYFPQEWKGQIPKPENTKKPYVIETRIRQKLDENELASTKWPMNIKLTYDVSDAIGLGLHYLNRFGRERVFHGVL